MPQRENVRSSVICCVWIYTFVSLASYLDALLDPNPNPNPNHNRVRVTAGHTSGIPSGNVHQLFKVAFRIMDTTVRVRVRVSVRGKWIIDPCVGDAMPAI